MASPSGRPPAALIDALFAEPHRFDFFQAVRLLERSAAAARRDAGPEGAAAAPDGVVRFRAASGLSFPLAEIAELQPGATAEMRVGFIGLNGASGVLPRHYSELVLQALRSKNAAPADFLDLFNHRAVALHLLAWRKYRLAANVDGSAGSGEDPITAALYAMVGLATPGLRGRLAVEDEVFLHYGGLFAQRTRSAAGLEALLSDYLGRDATITQFAGRWAPLAREDWTRLGSRQTPLGHCARLGVDAVAGTHVWDVQGGFRIRLGPLDYRQFAALMPGSPLMNEVVALARSYAGPGLAFDVELALEGAAVPACVLGEEGDCLPRLGWNTWLAAPRFPPLVTDAVLRFAQL